MSDPGSRTERPLPEQAISVEERKHKQHFDYAIWRERERDKDVSFRGLHTEWSDQGESGVLILDVHDAPFEAVNTPRAMCTAHSIHPSLLTGVRSPLVCQLQTFSLCSQPTHAEGHVVVLPRVRLLEGTPHPCFLQVCSSVVEQIRACSRQPWLAQELLSRTCPWTPLGRSVSVLRLAQGHIN